MQWLETTKLFFVEKLRVKFYVLLEILLVQKEKLLQYFIDIIIVQAKTSTKELHQQYFLSLQFSEHSQNSISPSTPTSPVKYDPT